MCVRSGIPSSWTLILLFKYSRYWHSISDLSVFFWHLAAKCRTTSSGSQCTLARDAASELTQLSAGTNSCGRRICFYYSSLLSYDLFNDAISNSDCLSIYIHIIFKFLIVKTHSVQVLSVVWTWRMSVCGRNVLPFQINSWKHSRKRVTWAETSNSSAHYFLLNYYSYFFLGWAVSIYMWFFLQCLLLYIVGVKKIFPREAIFCSVCPPCYCWSWYRKLFKKCVTTWDYQSVLRLEHW